MQYDNEKRGVLFINRKKEKDNQPDFRGTIQIEGIEYELSAWQKEKCISISAKVNDFKKEVDLSPTKKEYKKEYEEGIPF